MNKNDERIDTTNNPPKPMSLVREDLIKSIVGSINQSGLPAFVLRPIFQDLLNQIQALEARELESDRAKYEASVLAEEGKPKP